MYIMVLRKAQDLFKKIIRQEHRITVFLYFIRSESISPSARKKRSPLPLQQKKAIAPYREDKKRSPLTVKINSDRLSPFSQNKRSPLTVKINSDRLFPLARKKAIAPLPLARKKAIAIKKSIG
jgi:hypothetical protein